MRVLLLLLLLGLNIFLVRCCGMPHARLSMYAEADAYLTYLARLGYMFSLCVTAVVAVQIFVDEVRSDRSIVWFHK